MLKYLVAAVLLALCGSVVALAEWGRFSWDKLPDPILPEKRFRHFGEPGQEIVNIVGFWVTKEGYEYTPWTAASIHCNRQLGFCSESIGTLLRHDEGEDLESEAVLYTIERWAKQNITLKAVWRKCMERRVEVDLDAQTAVISWAAAKHQCIEHEPGSAFLAGSIAH